MIHLGAASDCTVTMKNGFDNSVTPVPGTAVCAQADIQAMASAIQRLVPWVSVSVIQPYNGPDSTTFVYQYSAGCGGNQAWGIQLNGVGANNLCNAVLAVKAAGAGSYQIQPTPGAAGFPSVVYVPSNGAAPITIMASSLFNSPNAAPVDPINPNAVSPVTSAAAPASFSSNPSASAASPAQSSSAAAAPATGGSLSGTDWGMLAAAAVVAFFILGGGK